MRRRRRLRLAALGALVLIGVSGAPAAARDVAVTTDVEAWYATLPRLGARPEGTLHVGLTVGIEDSRTYLTLDLTAVPADATIVSGTLTLPVDTTSSQAPETATMQACVAGSPGPSVDGSTDPPPAIDCTDAVSAEWGDGAFTVDLAPFGDRLRTVGIALVAVPESLATWHVALWSRSSTAPGAVAITASLVVRDPGATTPVTDDEPTRPTIIAAPRFAGPGTELATGIEPVPLPPTFAVPDAAPPMLGTAPVPPREAMRYADSLAFTLPLLLLALAWGTGYALTRPIAVAERRDVNPREGLRVPRRAPLRARAAREPRASG